MILCSVISQAQNKLGKNDDLSRIALTAFVPSQTEQVPVAAKRMLKNKIDRVITANGIASTGFNSRFIIAPKIEILTKDYTETAPVMTALTLAVTFNVGDGFEGTKFASSYFEVKGAGTNETKAYISAIKRINVNSEQVKSMVKTAKTKIIEYYNTNCDFIITKSKTLQSQRKYDEALFMLSSVPTVCKECFEKTNSLVADVYNDKINYECKTTLNKAKAIWNASQNIEGANEAGNLLATIDPSASCFSEVKSLHKSIAAKVKAIDNREWNFILNEQKLESQKIDAIKAIGVAYGENQPETIYKTEYISRW